MKIRLSDKELERELKALANKRRLAIIKFLRKNKEANVGDIAEAIKLSFKSTSKHLAVLKAVDIIEYEQRALSYYYKLAVTVPPASQALLPLL